MEWLSVEGRVVGLLELYGSNVTERAVQASVVVPDPASGRDPSAVSRVVSDQFPIIAPRRPGTSFFTNRMADGLGIAPWSLDGGIAAIRSKEA